MKTNAGVRYENEHPLQGVTESKIKKNEANAKQKKRHLTLCQISDIFQINDIWAV